MDNNLKQYTTAPKSMGKYDTMNIIDENSGEDSDNYNSTSGNFPKVIGKKLASSEIVFTPAKSK